MIILGLENAVTIQSPEELKWIPVLEGVEMAILQGDPARAGEDFVIRFRTDREIHVPLHWHPHHEPITVLAGAFRVALESSETFLLNPGGYVFIPAGVRHRTSYAPRTVVQVTGIGPFESIYVDAAMN